MKILIVSQSFYPDNFKINDLIKEFSDEGHDVTVLSGLGDYTTGKVHENYRFFRNRTETYNGCTIKRVRTISRRKGPIFRSLNYLSFVFFGVLWAFFSKEKYDLVYVYQPSPATMIYPGITAAKRSNAPLLIYCLDIWPEAVKAMSIQEGTRAFKWIHKLSKYAYNKANYILVSSQSFINYLHEENGIPIEKMGYLPQHADKVEWSTSQNKIDIKKADYNFVFTGNIGFVQDVETIIRAVAEIKTDKDFLVHIVGSGSNYDQCVVLATKLDVLSRVVFYGRQPADTMSEFYEIADACLLTLKFENKIGLTIPAKLQGYMAASKPVIAAIDGDAKRIIEEADCGLCVHASDAKEMASAMVEFMSYDEQKKKQLGRNAYNYFEEHFQKDTFVQETLNVMKDMLGKSGENL